MSEEPIGSAAEEAARLFAAVTGWVQGHVTEAGDHLATGAAECTYCPICRTVHLAREVSPEVREHLASAATSLMHAVAGLMTPQAPSTAKDRGPTVEHIDLDHLDTEWPDA